jgi:hypothetical protein
MKDAISYIRVSSEEQVDREVLADLCQKLDAAEVQFSAGVTGPGMVFFEAAVAHGHEGVMAKHLASSYRPGRRSAAWREIKPRLQGNCAAREVASYFNMWRLGSSLEIRLFTVERRPKRQLMFG